MIFQSMSCEAQPGKKLPNIQELVFHNNGKIHNIDKNVPCYKEVITQMINLLITSDDTFDMIVSPKQMEEFRVGKPWVEIIFKDSIKLMVGYISQRMSVKKILIFFKSEKPLYIFFGTPYYSDDSNLAANTNSDNSLYNLLSISTKSELE